MEQRRNLILPCSEESGSGGWWSTTDASGGSLVVKRNLNPTLVTSLLVLETCGGTGTGLEDELVEAYG